VDAGGLEDRGGWNLWLDRKRVLSKVVRGGNGIRLVLDGKLSRTAVFMLLCCAHMSLTVTGEGNLALLSRVYLTILLAGLRKEPSTQGCFIWHENLLPAARYFRNI